jgi:hypothetical protein
MRTIGWVLLALVVTDTTRLDGQQVRLRAELIANSAYLWRGVTLNRYPVGQVFGGLEINTRRIDFGVSGWLTGAVRSEHCGLLSCPEETDVHVADLNLSGLVRYLRGNTQFAVGANLYDFKHAPFESSRRSATTVELVGSVYALPDQHIQLALTTWWDIKKVDGFYFEATGTMPLVLKKSRTPQVFITATGGWNLTQTSGPGNPGYFAKRGFTHLSVETSWLAVHPDANGRGNTIQLYFRLQGNLDPATKSRSWPLGDAQSDQQFTFGVAWHPVFAIPPKRPPDM